jgi:hypothetical protein
MRSLGDKSGAAREIHLLDVPDMICKQRLRERNAGGGHPFHVSEAEYDLFTSYFVPPAPSEGFNVIVHTLTPAFRERAEPLTRLPSDSPKDPEESDPPPASSAGAR